ncbi:hypothetical protein D9M71_365300 [compost metagenome]
MAAGGGFGDDADAHAALDHPADRLEAGHLDAQGQLLAHLFHLVEQEGVQGGAFRQADVGVAQGVAQFQRLRPGQRVAVGHRQEQAVGAEVQHLQAAGGNRAGDDAEVGGTVQHAAHDVPAQPLLQVHRHPRAFGEEAGEDFREEFGDRRGVGEDADMPGGIAGVLGEFALQVVHLAHDQPRVLQQAFAGGRQFDAAAVTVEQAAAELAFQGLDSRAGGGRREEGLACALGEAGGLGDVDEQTQVRQIEMHGSGSVLAFT